MLSLSNRFSVLGIVVLVGIMTLSGCATHKYVKTEIGKVTPQIEQANNAIKENAERIDAVDRRATQGITAAQTAAQTAQTAADRANGAAQTAQNAAQAADRKADTANQGVQQAGNRINTLFADGSVRNLAPNLDFSTIFVPLCGYRDGDLVQFNE